MASGASATDVGVSSSSGRPRGPPSTIAAGWLPCRPVRPQRSAGRGCSIPRRCMTRWPRWTRSPSSAPPSAASSRYPENASPRSARSSAATTSTAPPASPPSTGRTRRRGTALVDELARDGEAVLGALEGQPLPTPISAQAAALLATVIGQDLEEGPDGRIRIARRVARDRVISTVDPEARHGHKTVHHAFDGYKGHVAIDPDAEIVTATAVTPGSTGDASVALGLLAGELAAPADPDARTRSPSMAMPRTARARSSRHSTMPVPSPGSRSSRQVASPVASPRTTSRSILRLAPSPVRRAASPRSAAGSTRMPHSGRACAACPLVSRCTTSTDGRTIEIGPHEALLTAGRAATRDPAWRADYRATRPKVERKLAHLVRRRHGGRRARVRGTLKVGADFSLLAAAVNLARLAVLRVTGSGRTWVAIRP